MANKLFHVYEKRIDGTTIWFDTNPKLDRSISDAQDLQGILDAGNSAGSVAVVVDKTKKNKIVWPEGVSGDELVFH